MATLLGVQATKSAATPAQLIEQGYAGGRVKCISDKYVLTGDLSADDVIEMGSKLPKGAKILDARIIHTALGAGTLHVGWKASDDAAEALDADGIMTSVAVTSAGSIGAAISHSTNAFVNKVMAGEVQPIVTVATDSSATSGSINLDIFYVVD
jgi:hypothetical protein